MNKIFKIIWNKTTQRLEVVSELAKARGKAKSSSDETGCIESNNLGGGLKAFSLIAISAVGLGSTAIGQAAVTQSTDGNTFTFVESLADGDSVWGTNNTAIGIYFKDSSSRENLTMVGRNNQLSVTGQGYANRNSSSNYVVPTAVNIYGINNLVNQGNRVNVFGSNNSVNHSGVGNTGVLSDINVFGNNITTINTPSYGTFIGNNVSANASPLAVGNNLSVSGGSTAVGNNIDTVLYLVKT